MEVPILDSISGKRKFTVIKGGNTSRVGSKTREFVSAYVTDTRLMGVIGLYIHWTLSDLNGSTDLHQFFYLDAEEFGFETYRSLTGNDEGEFLFLEQSITGGLGGLRSEVTETEARYLIQDFFDKNSKLGLPWPEGKSEYSFLLKPKVEFSVQEKQVLVGKMCTPILSEYQLIHYFLMRIFGKDLEGASYLIDPSVVAVYKNTSEALGRFNFYKGRQEATLCKNAIERYEDESGLSYICESLVEINYKYKVVLSEVTIAPVSGTEKNKEKKFCIASAKERSSCKVTGADAALMVYRPEFLTVYEIATDLDDFDALFIPMMAGCMLTQHDNGRLFLEFNKDNDHVNKRVFRLNEDIHCLYYVSDYGQLILSAYSLAEISAVEKKIRKTGLLEVLVLSERYEFKEPILYEFIQSDFDDFTDFLSSIE
jgi:hypothetical protein